MLSLSGADFFHNQLFRKNSFRNTIRLSNRLDPDQARCFVGSDLSPNFLPKILSGIPSVSNSLDPDQA